MLPAPRLGVWHPRREVSWRTLDALPHHPRRALLLARADMILRFKRWQRFSTADADDMQFRVLVELQDIPSHAWSAAAA
ncbi:hypothetical protein C2845_PM02G14080 [Panicum miliaceum]|uniref:Uncharacterized protein n=1 Tax=Panicum miliaceum TaxID=4540 RepID=A0A3L6S6P8_PANMI|nr:hypothetical protein C2845_PM02G14080 [Panicum miliaceum]